MPPAAKPPLYATIDSPLGELLLLGDGGALRGLHIEAGAKGGAPARLRSAVTAR